MDKKKIFSVGLNPQTNVQEAHQFFDKYKDYIDSIFFEPMYVNGQNEIQYGYTNINTYMDNGNPITLNENVQYARDLGIRLDMIANGGLVGHHELSSNEVNMFYKTIEKYNPDEMTIIPEFKSMIQQQFPSMPLVYSFNAKPPTQNEYEEDYTSYVMSRHLLWNTNNWPNISKELRILTHNGCPECAGCANYNWRATHDCKELFKNTINSVGIEYYIAYNILFNRDLELFLAEFPQYKIIFKLAYRENMGFNEVSRYMDNYINHSDIQSSIKSEHQWRYFHLVKLIKEQGFNVDKVIEAKQQLWGQLAPGVKY